MSEEKRPSVLNEVRAWILAGAAVLAHTVAVVWWAATLSAKLDNLKEIIALDLATLKATLADHEIRLRNVERQGTGK